MTNDEPRLRLDAWESLLEMAEALDKAIEERNQARTLLRRYLRSHSRRYPAEEFCECALCVETRFTLTGINVAPKQDDPQTRSGKG